jgi:hypothetical protein
VSTTDLDPGSIVTFIVTFIVTTALDICTLSLRVVTSAARCPAAGRMRSVSPEAMEGLVAWAEKPTSGAKSAIIFSSLTARVEQAAEKILFALLRHLSG